MVDAERRAASKEIRGYRSSSPGMEYRAASSKPIRVLYCSSNVCLFGAERVLLHLLMQLDRQAVEPLVLLPGEGELTHAVRALDIPVITSTECLSTVSLSTIDAAANAVRLAGILRRHRIDILHLNLWYPPRDIAVLASAAWLAGAAFVVHVQNNMKVSTDYLNPCERFCFAEADRLICLTEFVRRALLHHTPGKRFCLGRAKTCVIAGGFAVDHPQISSMEVEQLRASLQIPAGAPVVGMVAALNPIKNQDVFLRAAALVQDRLPSARFLVVGSPYVQHIEYVNQLKQLVVELGLQREVQFLGYRRDVPTLLQLMDTVVLPSRSEALGGILVEAMMAGKPVVAANVDGVPEVVVDRENGFLIDGYEPAPYAERIIHLLTNRTLARAMGERGRVLAAERFDAAQAARQVEAVYAAIRKPSLRCRVRNVGVAAGLRAMRRWL